MNHRRLATVPGSALLLLLLASGSWDVAHAEGFAVVAAPLPGGGQIQIQFPAESDSYYRLQFGFTATTIEEPLAVAWEGPFDVATIGETGFLRVERIPRAASEDSDRDGLPDVYELDRRPFNPLLPADANQDFDGDGVPNRTEFLQGSDPLVSEPRLTTLSSSPLDGDEGVAVTRETVLKFSRPLAADTLLDSSRLFAEAAGRKLLSRPELSPDRRKATLFYLEPLPGATRVRVSFDASAIKDGDGKLVDADGDGAEGGVVRIEFDTLNNQPLPGTAVSGRVFASELVPGPDTGANAVHRPLEGAIITVDGMEETLRAVTDAAGNFTLTNAPAGRFFVHVDGRTAQGSRWPEGDFYPFVGKAWEAVAGREDNRAGGTGEVYLPLIKAGSLRPVSSLGPTYVSFPDSVLAANPTLEGVALMVPANALSDDSGNRGGRVGIAPVPPNRLPEMLPDDLQFPLVITVQTDGPRNFTEPVPVCVPNLPDPVTGLVLPPGAKSALWSFDHDKGYWEIVGPMTVSANGRLICSDPGAGVTQPGWHGTLPGTSGSGGGTRQETQRCRVAVLGASSTYTNRWVTFTTTTATQGGVWSWNAPGGEPASGMGASFQVRYQREGDYTIDVRYTTPNGKTQCQAQHNLRVTRLPCEISLTGPSRTSPDIWTSYRAEGTPTGGKYQWTVDGPGFIQAVGGGDAIGPEIEVSWSDFGDFKLAVEYTAKPGTADEQKCRAEKLVTISNALRILDVEGREVGHSTFLEPDDEVFWHGNLSEGDGDYKWVAGPDVRISGATDQVTGITFTRPGVRTVTLTYTPYQVGERPQTRHATVRVRDTCEVEILEAIRQDVPQNAPIVFQAVTQPASGGTVRWKAPGGSPSSGTGRNFTTQYATKGPKQIDVEFTNPNSDVCGDTAAVHIGPIDCRLTVLGPRSLSVVDGFEYEAKGNGGAAEVYNATLVETGDSLGTGAPGSGNPFRFLFAPALLRPGNYTLRVTYTALFHDVFDGQCSVDVPVTVTSAAALNRTGLRLHAGEELAETEPALGHHLFARINQRTGTVTRGLTGRNGIAHPKPVRLPANTLFHQHLLNPETFMVASAEFTTPEEGQAFDFPEFVFRPDTSPDQDTDGLTDWAERIVGSDPMKPDTDGDRVTDAAEVRAGTSPTGVDSAGPGLVASAATGGYAWDVCLSGNRALVAAGTAGLAVFNVFDRMRPVLIGQVDTPGDARAVACVGEFAAVADGAAGLAVVDLRRVPNLAVSHQLPLGAPVTAVAAGNGAVFAGLATGVIVMLDLATGAELGRRDIDGVVEDLLAHDRWIYALTLRQGRMRVTTLELDNGNLESRGELDLNGQKGAGDRRLRLVRADDRLYAVFTQGYAVLNLARPADLTLIREVVTGQAGWRHFGLNAGGLLVAAADPVSTDEGAHDIQLHRLGPDGTTAQFELQISTPGSAEAVALEAGLAYVADGATGLQVIRFQDADRAGLPPSVTVRAMGVNATVEENRTLIFQALASDDVGVARVEFFVDGFLVSTDDQFPFELDFITPPRAPDRDSLRVQARATDTGGNVGFSPELVLQLTADLTPPEVVGTSPRNGQEVSSTPASAVIARLNETVEAGSATALNFRLMHAGPDNQFDTGDDTFLTGAVTHQSAEQRVVLEFPQPLNTGRYRATLGPGLRDARGNVNAEAYQWEFRIIGPKVSGSLPVSFGASAGYAVRIRFSRAMDPLTTAAALRIFASGPDGSPDTPDDVTMPGAVRFEAVGTEAVVQFDPPLAPGQYFIRVNATATDTFGRILHEPWGTYFGVSQLDYGDGMTFEQSGNALGELGTGQEFRLLFGAPVDLAIINTSRSTVTLSRPDGTVLAADSAVLFRAHVAEAGDYVLGIARTENGQGSQYRVELHESTSATFQHDVSGQTSATLHGSALLHPGDVDQHEVMLEAGRQYWLSPDADSDTACRLRWSVLAPDGTPLLVHSLRCSDPLAVDALAGGVFRVRLEAFGSVVVPRLNVSWR